MTGDQQQQQQQQTQEASSSTPPPSPPPPPPARPATDEKMENRSTAAATPELVDGGGGEEESGAISSAINDEASPEAAKPDDDGINLSSSSSDDPGGLGQQQHPSASSEAESEVDEEVSSSSSVEASLAAEDPVSEADFLPSAAQAAVAAAAAPVDFSNPDGQQQQQGQGQQQQESEAESEAERMASYFSEDQGGDGGNNEQAAIAASTPLPSETKDSARDSPASSDSGPDGADGDGDDEQPPAEAAAVIAAKDPTKAAAAHMAAVAAAALAQEGQMSPRAAADYAKQLMPGVVPSHFATVAPLPQQGNNSGNQGGGYSQGGPTRVALPPGRARREPVSVGGVREMLLVVLQQKEQEEKQEEEIQEEEQQEEVLSRDEKGEEEEVEAKVEKEEDAEKVNQEERADDGAAASTGEGGKEAAEADGATETDDDAASLATEEELPNDASPDAAAAASAPSPPPSSNNDNTVMRTKVSTDAGFGSFLRHLMLLSDVMPEPSSAADGAGAAVTAMGAPIPPSAGRAGVADVDGDDDGGNDGDEETDETNKEGQDERRKREADAADVVIKTLRHAEAAYDDLFAMLPAMALSAAEAAAGTSGSPLSVAAMDKPAPSAGIGDAGIAAVDGSEVATDVSTTNDEEEEEEEETRRDDMLNTSVDSLGSLDDSADAEEEDDDDTVYDYGESSSAARKIVPDLLPPCISAGGDATSAFFRACRGSDEEAEAAARAAGKAALASGKVANGTSEDSTRSTSPTEASSVAASSTQSSAGGRSSFGIGSVLSSVKTRATGGGNKRPSPKSDSSEKGGMFGRRRKKAEVPEGTEKQPAGESGPPSSAFPEGAPEDPASTGRDYTVQIDREMLGLTVENVLERTVVRTVLPGGAAKRAGARVGSLIVKVGSVETANLTHFETIDELRQSQRPLKLVLRQIGDDALRGARDEMGRLIRGGGFGMAASAVEDGEEAKSQEGGAPLGASEEGVSPEGETKKEPTRLSPEAEKFASSLHGLWHDATRRRCRQQPGGMPNKRDEAISVAGERLVWILTLLVIGLEREAVRLEEKEQATAESSSLLPPDSDSASVSTASSSSSRHKHSHHTAKDYADAARSVSKQLLDYVKRHLEEDKPPPANETDKAGAGGMPGGGMQHPRRKRQLPPPPHVPMAKQLAGKKVGGAQSGPLAGATFFDRSLHSIGDVLHRTMTFLADPSSPPAALVRGEVIALLCDILDADTDMRLADEDTASSVAGGNAGAPINELGSAGSLLKLIVLNCSMMRSPGCVDPPQTESWKEKKKNEEIYGDAAPSPHHAHAGNRFLAVVHRLAASRSTSARVTACSLGPVLWAHLDFPHQLQLRGVITRALHDVEVIVRKSTATVLHEIAELAFDPRSVPWLVLMCERAMTDPEPQLRAAAMTLTWHLAEHLPNAFLGDASKGSRALRRLPPRTDPTFAEVYLLQCKLLPVATRLAEDRAPAVRLAVAAQCDRLCNALGDHWFSVIIDLLQALLGDTDERVRGEAMLCMPRLVDSVLSGTLGSSMPTATTNVLDSLLPLAIKLLKDPSVNVRVSLATACGELLTLLVGLTSQEEIFQPPPSPTRADGTGSVESSSDSDLLAGLRQHKRHIDETLIPLVQRLLHDTDPEVTSAALRAVTNASRGNVREISTNRKFDRSHSVDDDTMSVSSQFSYASIERKEPVFIPVLSEKQVLRLLPTLSDLSENPQWRVRQSAVEIVPALLGCTHLLETRSEIAQLCVQLMDDEVDAVRRTAAECLCLGGGSLARHGEDDGGQWISAIVIPQIRKCSESQNCKQRMLSLKMVEVVLVNSMCPPAKSKARTLVADADGKEAAIPPLKAILDIAASLSEDRVVNVRLNVGRVFASIAHHPVMEEEELNFIVDVVEKQLQMEQGKERGDRDVIYFAKQATSIVKNRIEETSLSQDDASISLASTTTN